MDLKSIENSLLDISRMNNLINFKERVHTTVEIKNQNIKTLYDTLFLGNEIEVFNIDKYVSKFSGEKDLSKSDILYEDVLRQIEDLIKDNQMILYKQKGSVNLVLKNLIKKNNESKIERGLHILYISFGMFNYTEDNTNYKAPFILVPVNIVENARAFKISLNEEEAILNPNFKHKLLQEYKLKIEDINLSTDLNSYIDNVNSKLENLNFYVSNESYISLFSFNKINMYYDILENEKEIKKHNLIKALFNEDSLTNVDMADVSTAPKIILDADHSQINAINAVRRGESIVLVGPPGTGKSQTITNIISSAIYDGKKVLFVSEKLAALNVVYDKLKNSSFAEFLLPLHSININKKEVIKDLYETLYKEKTKTKKEALQSLDEIMGIENLLDDYANSLHKKIDVYDLSAYEVFSLLESVRKYQNDISIDDKKLSLEYRDEVVKTLDNYKTYEDIISYDYKKTPFYLIKDLKNFKKYKNTLENVKNELAIIVKNVTNIKKEYDIDIKSLNEYYKFITSYNVVYDSKYYKKEFFSKKNILNYIELANKLSCNKAKMENAQKTYQKIFNDNILKIDTKEFMNKALKYKNKNFKFLRPSFRKFKKEIRLYLKYKHINLKEIIKALSSSDEYKSLSLEYITDIDAFNKILKFKDIDEISPKDLFKTLNAIKNIIDVKYFKINKNVLLNDYKQKLIDDFVSKDIFNIDINNYSIYELYKIIVSATSKSDMSEWYLDFKNKVLDKLEANDAKKFLDYALDNNYMFSEFKNVFLYSYYNKLKDNLIKDIPSLREFNIFEMLKLQQDFKSLDYKRLDINKSLIKEMILSKKPSPNEIASGSIPSIIKREYLKKRRQLSIREIINLNPEFIQTLKPVFLMSPLSVSTYLTKNVKFDLVIFDEASQIYPEDSIGAILRGRQLVICGDPKQMPPTNFFKMQTLEDCDAITSDFESVLDMAMQNYKIYNLSWHYRSQKEELIAFSNKYIYNNSLTSFPDAKHKGLDEGLEYYKVNGIYDKEQRCNEEEAIKVRNLVLEHYQKYKNTRSIGVVALSISQQKLIERKLKDALKDNLDNEIEPLFIKNLETVQGDERDTIIISVGYGYTKDKKFIQNFGPLNREGGERRLNVLISRAKLNIKLVTSIEPTDISDSKALGVSLLKKYLSFAKEPVMSTLETNNTPIDFSHAIYDYLLEEGYEGVYKLGYSQDKIDIALKKPNSRDFMYAIECDGETYYKSLMSSDRYRLRESVLERRGFKYIRVYSTLWYRDQNLCKKLIIEKLRNDVWQEDDEIKIEVEENSNDKIFKEYVYSPDEKIINLYKNHEIDFESLVKRVLDNESPLNEEWFIERYKEIFEGDPYVEFELLKAMHLNQNEIVSKDGYLINNKDTISLRVPANGSAVRNICYVSVVEICYGMRDVLIKNEALTKEDLYKMVLKLLGYKKLTKQIESKFDMALEELEKRFVVIKKDLKIKVVNI